MLVNPDIISVTHKSETLILQANTDNAVDCPIFYKGIKYNDAHVVYANGLGYGLKIPYYEVRCTGYPIYYYNMPNYYLKENIDIYKPQFYVTYKSDQAKTKYHLKFTNPFPSEICLFSIRDGADTPNPADFSSNCGGTSKSCYAPCNNVELTLDPSKPIVEILVQTRHCKLEKNRDGSFEGYSYKKFGKNNN